MKIKEYIDKIVEKGSNEDMEKLQEMFENLMYKIKEEDEECYDEYKLDLYEMANGKKITGDMAKEWVSNMVPSAKWTLEETTDVMKNLGYNLDPVEFYVVANMMWSDNYELVKDNPELALKLAYNWLNDKDIGEEKLYDYWRYVVK